MPVGFLLVFPLVAWHPYNVREDSGNARREYRSMSGNEFGEWPEVHAPSGNHGAGTARTYDFPLTEEDRLAEEDVSRGLSVGNIGGSIAEVKPKGFVYRHRRELVGTAAITVVAAVVAGLALNFRQHVDSQEVLSSCQQSVDIYHSNTERLKKTIDGAADDLLIAKNQVQDPQTVADLRAAVDKGNEKDQAHRRLRRVGLSRGQPSQR